MPNPPSERSVRNLTAALLAGEWLEEAMVERTALAVGKRFRFLRPFVKRVLVAYPSPPTFEVLQAFGSQDRGLLAANARNSLPIATIFVRRPLMQPIPAAVAWPVPLLPTSRRLAEWLHLDDAALAWYVDLSGRHARASSSKVRHYIHQWMPKRNGGARLLEAPKPTLKQLQRQILRGILAHVPTHAAAHGFVRKRSAITNARSHCGQVVVLRFDLADFFGSIAAPRVHAIFRSIGYPQEVARSLTGLCTVGLPRDVWDARPNPLADGSDHVTWQRLADRHLPQGAPTSPALANLCAFRLDCRLAALATELGATYTRYADDLTFSGGIDLQQATNRVRRAVIGIVAAEGFMMNVRKSRTLPRSLRQTVTGIVVNATPNIARDEFDRLKAILTNCVRHGPSTQNRQNHPDFRAHLLGVLSHVSAVNPNRVEKLRAIFAQIDWTR